MKQQGCSIKKWAKPTLKISISIALIVCFVYLYLLEIVKLYEKESTTFTTKRIQVKNAKLPLITFCMDKGLKQNVLVPKIGSARRGTFLGVRPKKNINISMSIWDL